MKRHFLKISPKPAKNLVKLLFSRKSYLWSWVLHVIFHSIFLQISWKNFTKQNKIAMEDFRFFLKASNFTEKLTLADFLDLDKFTLLRRGNLTTQCCQMFLTIWRFLAKKVKKLPKTPQMYFLGFSRENWFKIDKT